jgi:hypothetical protein
MITFGFLVLESLIIDEVLSTIFNDPAKTCLDASRHKHPKKVKSKPNILISTILTPGN